jgi:predicted 2-oxoglutarate/Fe(II)-dependent dioxygenase YbiX
MSSILYLNDDYEGGETNYEDGTIFKPKKGRLLFFDGKYHKHGVNKVRNNIRYTVATWYKKI